jgi:membrane associated rhomboid family serine protease
MCDGGLPSRLAWPARASFVPIAAIEAPEAANGDVVNGDREKIFNLPSVITALIGILFVVQLATELAPAALALDIVERFSFIPARLTYLLAPDAVMRELANNDILDAESEIRLAMVLNDQRSALLTPITYAFLHGDWTHLSINCLTLAAFGAPVARRFEPARFLAFLALCAITGALAHQLIHPYDITPVVGASAAISGTMGAIVRFAFTPGARLGERRFARLREDGAEPEPAPLSQLTSNRRAMFFLAIWFALNLFFGLFPQAAGASSAIAWEAHIGGFIAGLFLFGPFDAKIARRLG